MEHSLRYLVGVHHARIYYNLTSIHSVLRMAPFEAPSECSSGCSKSGRDGLRQDTEENVPSPGCGSRTDRRVLQDSERSGSSLRARSNKEMALWEQESFR